MCGGFLFDAEVHGCVFLIMTCNVDVEWLFRLFPSVQVCPQQV